MLLTFATVLLFFAATAAMAALWNRCTDSPARVPWRMVALFWLLCCAYQSRTLFTPQVDLRGAPHNVYPWQAAKPEQVDANTGIVFSQLAPWTKVARDQLLRGELPHWNRHAAAGAPLIANQQTAIFHPFTLLGLPLPVGKAFTLSATLRLFTLLFFTFILMRGWGIRDEAALFGAVAYAFCTFHVVWLLFPLGLANMMLPLALVGVQRRSFVLLTLGLSLSVLGGHPESALWVWLTVAAYVVYERKRVAVLALAFVAAMLLTAFFWLPTLQVLRTTERFQVHTSDANPTDHGLSYEWLLPLLAPNILGNPADATYQPPRGEHSAVLNDYGEVASGYAGLLTLSLALAAPFVTRRRPLFFALGLMLFALLTIAETPLWREMLRAVPLAGISIQQRLRILWDLGVCIAAALTLHERGNARRSGLIAGAAFVALYAARGMPSTTLGVVQMLVPLATLAVFMLVPRRAMVAAGLVLVDLLAATWRYNPPARPRDVYPVTPAIAYLQQAPKPSRMAAWGWSFLPETPGWYGLEDIKATDPIQHAGYMFLLRGYLDIDRGSYDLVLGNVERPFFDYLNVRHLYVPPGAGFHPKGFVERYRGPDGVVLENLEVLPRYFFVREARVEPELGPAIWYSREIANFRERAVVDRGDAPFLHFEGGEVRVVAYESNRTVLDVVSRSGTNLLVTSDVHWPHWRATWNARPLPVVTVNGAFLGVYVPEGRGRLELRYAPRWR